MTSQPRNILIWVAAAVLLGGFGLMGFALIQANRTISQLQEAAKDSHLQEITKLREERAEMEASLEARLVSIDTELACQRETYGLQMEKFNFQLYKIRQSYAEIDNRYDNISPDSLHAVWAAWKAKRGF